MSQNSKDGSIIGVLRGLFWPIVLGLIPYCAFLLAIRSGVITNELILRYCASHIVSYVATGMFFIGLAALFLKALEVVTQYGTLGNVQLDDPPEDGQKVEEAGGLLDYLESLPRRVRNSYLWRRLRDALLHVERNESADELGDELKYLSDMDAGRQHESYSLVRIIVWATPMLGFLGTVIGIAAALGQFEFKGEDFTGAVAKLKDGLFVAFDTTALALCLTIALMFIQFLIDRLETSLLAIVDSRANEEMTGRFQQLGGGSDPSVKTIQRLGQAVVESTEKLVERQSTLWESSIDAAQQKWTQMSHASGEQLQAALATAINAALERYTDRMTQAEQRAAEQLRHRWEQWQVALSENARILHSQQQEIAKQGEVMKQVVEATGDVIKLEQALNDNLGALAGSKNFEDTVMSLSAAIQLLTTKLGPASQPVDLTQSESQGRAA